MHSVHHHLLLYLVQVRHVGDLGNIEANDEGVAVVNIEDHLIAMEGNHSVIQRAIVVHEGIGRAQTVFSIESLLET